MTFLEMCKRFVSDHGIGGGTGPTSVTGQTGELKNVINWIADAAVHVDNMWLDWRYLWVKYTGALVIGDLLAPAPATGSPRLWDIKRMKIRQAGGSWGPLDYLSRQQLEDAFDPDNAAAGMPTHFTIEPNDRIKLSCPPDAAYEVKGEFWRRPVRLVANDDMPLIPEDFWRVIHARASIQYGNREDAPEIISGAESEFIDVLDKLESDQLEDQSRRRSSTDRMADHFESPAYSVLG